MDIQLAKCIVLLLENDCPTNSNIITLFLRDIVYYYRIPEFKQFCKLLCEEYYKFEKFENIIESIALEAFKIIRERESWHTLQTKETIIVFAKNIYTHDILCDILNMRFSYEVIFESDKMEKLFNKRKSIMSKTDADNYFTIIDDLIKTKNYKVNINIAYGKTIGIFPKINFDRFLNCKSNELAIFIFKDLLYQK